MISLMLQPAIRRFFFPRQKKKKKIAWSQVTDAVSTETQMKQTCLRQNMIMN